MRDSGAVASEHRDRILDWRHELHRLAAELPSLPAAARLAVYETVARFLREDAETARADEAA